MLFQVSGEAGLDKGADPLVGGDENIGRVADRMRLQQVEGIGVEAIRVGFDQLDFDRPV